MRRVPCFLIVLAALLFPPTGTSGFSRAEKPLRDLTLMVYMCGSNLESGSGAASSDIAEMMESGFDSSVSVLIMTGGSACWNMPFKPDQIQISELNAAPDGEIRFRIVRSSTAESMGEAGTLSAFLRYGIEKYPAEDYALILWDHGGGPLEGVCWDEMFSMDNLRLEELREGLQNAGLPKKLRWIGFDACLMADLEVAETVAPFAEYMIASQETETVSGWNYGFLGDMAGGGDGAAAGKLIVDAYFSRAGESGKNATLACIDLSGIQKVSEELNGFFSSVSSLDEETFVKLSSYRLEAAGFGNSVLPSGSDAYDLVDLYDLSLKMENMIGDGSALRNALSSAVVYTRSGLDGAHGLSVYYPCANKYGFSSGWRKEYGALCGDSIYLRHVEAFGSLLTGEEQVLWNQLRGEESGADEDGNHFSMQLSSAQAAQYVSGQLLILGQGRYVSEKTQNYCLVGSFPAQMDENGLVTAVFSGRTLYIRKEDGGLAGPVSYIIRPESPYNILTAAYSRPGETLLSGTTVAFELEREAGENGTVPFQIRVLDEATGTFSSRLAFSEEDYASCVIPDMFRMYPGLAPDREQPGFSDWAAGDNERSSTVISLPDRWDFVYQEELLGGSRYYAVFQITDARGNSYTSGLIPMTNRNQKEIALSPDRWSDDGCELSVSLRKDVSKLERGLRLQIALTNKSGTERDFWLKNILLNGCRQIEDQHVFSPGPQQTETAEFFIPGLSLAGLPEIESLAFSLIQRPRERGSASGTENRLLFIPDGCTLSDAAPATEPLGSGKSGQVSFSVLEIEPGVDWDDDFQVAALVENDGENPFSMKGNVLVNGRLQLPISSEEEIPAGCSRVVRFNVRNCLPELAGTTIRLSAEDDFLTYYILEHELIQRMGQNPVRSLSFLPDYDGAGGEAGEIIRIPLKEPFVLQRAGVSSPLFGYVRLSGEEMTPVFLTESSFFRAEATGIHAGADGAFLTLLLENLTPSPIRITMGDFAVNGRQAFLHQGSADSHLLAPGAEKICSLILPKPDGFPEDEEIEEISLSFSETGGGNSFRASVRLREEPAE